jgi:hypothetical protein
VELCHAAFSRVREKTIFVAPFMARATSGIICAAIALGQKRAINS